MIEYDPAAHGALCARCPLNGQRVVPPEGPVDATFVVVGEAPIREDEIRQRPFISAGGRLLEEMLEEANLTRSEVWLTNVLLCRPKVPGMVGAKQHDLNTLLAWIRLQNRQAHTEHRKNGTPLKLIESPIACCRPRLLNELREREKVGSDLPNGTVVLALGNHATHALTGKQGVLARRGSPVPIEIKDGYTVAKWDPRPEGT